VNCRDDDSGSHRREEDECHHSKYPAPKPLADLAPGDQAGVTEEPPAPKPTCEQADARRLTAAPAPQNEADEND
jgi:hypothetical protein